MATSKKEYQLENNELYLLDVSKSMEENVILFLQNASDSVISRISETKTSSISLVYVNEYALGIAVLPKQEKSLVSFDFEMPINANVKDMREMFISYTAFSPDTIKFDFTHPYIEEAMHMPDSAENDARIDSMVNDYSKTMPIHELKLDTSKIHNANTKEYIATKKGELTMNISKNGNPLEIAEMEITMLGNSEHDPALQDYLRDAGFLVKSTDKVTPDWSKSLGKEALENLSLPQLDSLVRVAHTDLSQRIANDVKQGMSVEEAYMFRASTDPAAILIAQASIIKQDKLTNALSELKQSADLGKQALATSFELKENFQKVYFEKTYQPNEKRGLEQAQYWISESIKKNPGIASLISAKAVKELINNKIDWREPELAADKIITSIKENTKDKGMELSALSTPDFIKHAAKEYVKKFSEIENAGHDKGTASSVAVAHIKTLASKAKLKIMLKDLPDNVLQAASKSTQEVEKLLNGRVKPSRLAAKSKGLENKKER